MKSIERSPAERTKREIVRSIKSPKSIPQENIESVAPFAAAYVVVTKVGIF